MTFKQIEQLWIRAGGDAKWAPLMASIAIAESGGNTQALNNDSNTMDYSVGLWQINYYGGLRGPRTARYGSPEQLRNDPLAQAKAAVNLFDGGRGIGNWKGDRAYEAYMASGAPGLKQFMSGGSPSYGNGPQSAGASGGKARIPPQAKGLDDQPGFQGISDPNANLGLFDAANLWQTLGADPNASPETRMLASNMGTVTKNVPDFLISGGNVAGS